MKRLIFLLVLFGIMAFSLGQDTAGLSAGVKSSLTPQATMTVYFDADPPGQMRWPLEVTMEQFALLILAGLVENRIVTFELWPVPIQWADRWVCTGTDQEIIAVLMESWFLAPQRAKAQRREGR